MAQLAVAAVGALALGPVGLGLTTAGTGFMLGSLAYSLMAPGQKSYGPRLNDLKVTGTDYGACIPWIAGAPRVAGQIAWASARRETAKTESQGKGGGPSYTSYTYDVDLLIILSENPIQGVRRVWSNGELVYSDGVTKDGAWVDMRVYLGDDDQLPDPSYEAAVGSGNAPAFRGMGSVMIQGLQLGGGGNIPNLTFELYVSAPDVTTLWASSAGALTEISERAQRYNYQAVSSGYGPAWVRGADAFAGPRYVEFDLSAAGASRNWIIGAVSRAAYSAGAYPSSPTSAGVWAITNLGTPGYYTNGSKTNYTAGLFDTDWVGRAGIMIDNTAGILRVYLNGTLMREWSTAGVQLDPYLSSYQFVGGTAHICDILRSRFDWVAAPPGVGVFGPEPVNLVKPAAVSLDATVSDLLLRAGYDAADFDVSRLVGRDLRALAVGQVASTRATLEVLLQAFFLECSGSDELVFWPRAANSVASIPFQDLGMSASNGGEDEPFALTLGNDLELPAQLALTYPNVADDFQAATEVSDRLLSGQQSTETISTALGMTPSEAKAVVDGLLMDRVASLATATIKLPLKYARLEPGDVITVTDRDGRAYRLRIQSKKDALPILEFQCVLDDVGAIDSAAVTDDGYTESAAVIQTAGTELRALDIPILRDVDDAPGYYVAVAPVRVALTDKWPGALVAQSWNGTDYEHLLTSTAQAVMGMASSVLGSWSGGAVFDEKNTVTVAVSGELASSTREAMLLNETINALLIGNEVIRFRNAALLSAGTYLLSGLLRGQRGTEWAMGAHGADERVVLLGAALRRVTSQTSEIGLLRQLKAVTLGAFLSNGLAQDFTDASVGLKPFSPANPRALADGADLVVTWQRRTRHSYQYGGASPVVPVGEAVEAYRVRVLSGVTVLRSDTVAVPVYRYTADMQATDGVASSDALSFEICQLSAIAGPGYPSSVGAIAP